MSLDKETQERQAMNIYCQLADLENIIDVMNFAFHAEDEGIVKAPPIYWGSIIQILKKEVVEAKSLAENLERDIRATHKNNDLVGENDNQEQQSHTPFADDFVVFPVGVIAG